MSTNAIVVARYNEDLDWINKLGDFSIVIYNKGENFPFDFPRLDVPNIGRESETFVRFIIEFYDQLKNFETVTFLQGNPLEHCDELFNVLGHVPDTYLPLCKHMTIHSLSPILKIHNHYQSTINKLFDIENGTKMTEQTQFDMSEEVHRMIILCDLLGIKIPEKLHNPWSTGAQYIVRSTLITNKKLEWWIDFHKLINYCYKKGNRSLGYAIEHSWPLIWNHSSQSSSK